MNKINNLFQRFCILITTLLMLSAIAITKNHSLFGHKFVQSSNADTDTATIVKSDDESITINSTNIASDIRGYGGAVPMKIQIRNGTIDNIEILENAETPDFLNRVKENIIGKYIGKTVSEAKTMQVDAVSGATLSSRAVKETLKRSLAIVPADTEQGNDANEGGSLDVKLLLAMVVSIAAAVIPLFYRERKYRIVQLICNVAIIGLYTGTFISFSSMTNQLSNGITWQNIPLLILLVTALLYPLFGKSGYYCAWVCPFGSAQELLGKVSKRKIHITSVWTHRLDLFRKGLWACLMLLAWSGILLEWMDYELFTAFLWQSASWIVISFALVFLILSIFINRPYCRFVCPTGTILKTL